MPDTPMETTPPRPELEVRVTLLEQNMGDVKSILGQMLPMIVRIDATLPHLATKTEMQSAISGVESKISGVESKIGGVESKIGGVESKIGELRGEMHREIGGLEGKIGGLEGKIGGLEGKIGGLEGKIGDLRADLAEKPSKTYIWLVLGVLIAAYAAGLAGLAVLK